MGRSRGERKREREKRRGCEKREGRNFLLSPLDGKISVVREKRRDGERKTFLLPPLLATEAI